MGSGESGPMDLGGAERSRIPSAASPAAFWLLCRRGQSNPPSADGGIPCKTARRGRRALRLEKGCSLIAPSSVTASPCHLSLSPLSLRDIIPTPFGLRPFPPDRGNRPLDKGSRPPRGRLFWGGAPSSAPVCALGHLPPRGKAIVVGRRNEVSHKVLCQAFF